LHPKIFKPNLFYMHMKVQNVFILVALGVANFVIAQDQIITIPDIAFKTYLIENTQINTNGDNEVQLSEAIAFDGTIDCSNKNISDLTGIEAFVNLTELYCYKNNLIYLNVSQNINLTKLNCRTNKLTTLDVSNNTKLNTLFCHENKLSILDVSVNTKLKVLNCQNNKLTSLNLKNGSNTKLSSFLLNLKNNEHACIEVDDKAYSDTKWKNNKDETACYSEKCITPIFEEITPVCAGETFTLPTISENEISGSWLPEYVDTSIAGTKEYTFIPTTCQNKFTTTIQILPLPEMPSGETKQQFVENQTIDDLDVNGENLVWYADQELTTNLQPNTILTNNTTYYVVSKNENCHSVPLAITVEQVAGYSDFELYGFKYYPSPVYDVLHFSSNEPIQEIVLNNTLGQKIKVNTNLSKTKLYVSSLESGNYFVKITIQGVSKTIKIVKS